jgi:hypothetical protein
METPAVANMIARSAKLVARLLIFTIILSRKSSSRYSYTT